MDELDARAIIGDALAELSSGLGPFVAQRFRELSPALADWTTVLERKDRQAGRFQDRYNPRDLSLQLRALTESFGSLGYPFSGTMNRQATNCASELRGVRNKWAHNEEFTTAEIYRALDSAEILLRAAGAVGNADAVAARKIDVLATMAPAHAADQMLLGTVESEAPPQEGAPTQIDTTEELIDAAPSDTLSDRPTTQFPPDTTSEVSSSGAAKITVSALKVLSYAQARAAVPVIDEISIDYQGAEQRGASIEVEAVCPLGSLGDPKIVIVDLDGTSPSTLRNADLLLDAGRMLAVESPIAGEVRVTLRSASGEVIAVRRETVEVLAANQWVARPVQLSLELLAAFVQPNSRAVAPLLLEASDRLQVKTGNSALDGYQQGSRDRVDAIVEAIYEAIRARDIRYAEPPASWGLTGQKVRTPAEVLEGRLGTCMDTTVTLAAVLEEAGINSTLWLLEDHIFLGYWRDDASLDGPAQADISEVINYLGLGQMSVVETTLLTGGGTSRPFADALRSPHIRHLGDLSRFLGVTDVKQARLAGIFPLPSRSITEHGEVVVREYKVAEVPDALQYAPSPESLAGTAGRQLPPRVSIWKNALLDLSLRNRLIHYGERAGYPLAVPQPSLPEFEDMVNSGSTITLLPSDRLPNISQERGIRFAQDLPETQRAAILTERKQVFVGITEATYTARLRALAYKARTIIEETGANNLYLAFGMLRWVFNERELRSPLILVPVRLEAAGRGQVFRLALDEAGESTPNYCLLEKLRVSFGIEIPGLANPAVDNAGIDLRAAFAATRQALTAARLPFTVEDTVDLSILQFAKYRLWKDLDENWDEFASNPLVSHLIRTPNEAFDDPAAPPEDIDLDALGNSVPVAADSSQLDAVAEAVALRTFVLEGPPGTGKSQTITNLLAHALANGKRVLFVAEKRAALDVVKQRLDAVGLGPFCLDLHDKGARPNAVRAQIKEALDAVARPDGAALKVSAETAATSRGSLRRYAERLHEPNTAGLSLYSARSQLLASADDIPALPVTRALVAGSTDEQLSTLRDVLRKLPETADLAHPSKQHPWGFVDAANPPVNAAELHAAAREFDAALAAARAAGAPFEMLSALRTPATVDRWSSLARAPRYPLDVIDAVRERTLSGEVPALMERISAVEATKPTWFATVAPEALELDVRAIHERAVAADESSFFGRGKRRRAALADYGATLKVDPKAIKPRDITPLTTSIAETASQVEDLRRALSLVPIPVVTGSWNPYLRDDASQATRDLQWAKWLGDTLGHEPTATPQKELRAYYQSSAKNPDLAAALKRLAAAWRSLARAARLGEPDGTGTDPMTSWAGAAGFFAAWDATSPARTVESETPVTLDRWMDFVIHLEPLRERGLANARQALLTGAIPADIATLAFDKGIALVSIGEREQSQGLESFDIAAHNRTIDRFTTSAREIRAELPRWVPAEIIAKRRIDPSYEGGMMGELRRQLNRQRGGMSVRALFEHYGDLITQIAPCALMSPESVSRFFPARSRMFDIVVFDEASQIRVADAVGAIGRGTSIVVVGDSKQMPPTSFAEVGTDIELDTSASADVVADEESILSECVQARVPRKWLSWHYRSQDESLILFSNHAYYEGRLSSFPAPWRDSAEVSEDHGISLVRVSGHFDRAGRGRDLRTNRVEATAIVDEVSRRFAASSHATPSLGIVTFNAQQRTLIETLLREAPDERIARALDERDGLFVKNLENVQGDERDVILFSVAFSANDRGVIPLNFGPLSRAGGERRLNVAITRARRQVILYASFDPTELRAEQTASVGIKHLKAYLELAASGVESTTDSAQRETVTDRHRDEVANELRYRGFAVRTDVGLSDFRVDISIASADDPAQPLVAVLLDGEGWRARRTVADRDGLPVDVLHGLMKWPVVERVWLPEWLQQQDATLDRLVAVVQRAADVLRTREMEADVAATVLPPGSTSPIDLDPVIDRLTDAPAAADSAAAELRHARLREFVEWTPKRSGTTATLDQLPSMAATERVRAVMREIIQQEGPIHKIRLVKLVAEAFGLSRVAASRSAAILRCLPSEYTRTTDKSCAWPTGVDPAEWRDVRRSRQGDGRNFDHVPLEEIANAMAVVAELGGGMNELELKREALALFGGKRMTEGVAARLDEGVRRGIDSGRIERDDRGRFLAVID